MQKKPQKDPEHKGDKTSTLEGVIGITPKGIGYVKIPDREEDIEIDSLFLNTALHRDTVRVMLHPQTPGERVSGEVVEILTRNKMEYVGVLERHQDFYFLVPQDMRMYVDIIVPASKAGGAEHGEKVLVAITSWDDPKKSPTGEVIKVIGKPGDNNVEMEAIVLDTGLRPDFPEKALREAEAIKKNEEAEFKRDIELRRDMRNVTTFTIDPVDAKDFDDAISIREIPGNLIEIGIHIADVSHYLRPGTDLDWIRKRHAGAIRFISSTAPSPCFPKFFQTTFAV